MFSTLRIASTKIATKASKEISSSKFTSRSLSSRAPKLRSLAAVCSEWGSPLELKEVDIPTPGDGEVLVKIHQCGVCHTDLHAISGDWSVKSKIPLIPGHEGAGVIVQLGENSHKHVAIGTRVGIPWLFHACGACEYCMSGWETLCESQMNAGFSVDGGLSQYVLAKATHVIPIPDSLSFSQAAPVLCAGVTSYKGLKETETKPGEFVAIIGASGGLGHLAVQYATAMGMRVVAVDIGADRLAYTKKLGAEFAVDATSPDMVAQVQALTGGGVHGALVLAPQASAFTAGVDIARRKGTVVSIGLPAGSFPCPILDVVLKRITIRGSIVGTRKDMQEALDFAARGLVKCDVEEDSVTNINTVFDRLRDGTIKGRVVVRLSTGEATTSAQDVQRFAAEYLNK